MGYSFEGLSGKVIGAGLAVHREIGPGFLESVYHSAVRVALTHRGIPFQSECPVEIGFESVRVGRVRIDLVVAREIVVEIKAVEAIHQIHAYQLRSYLRATGLHVGLLLNFNTPTLTIKRIVLD